MHRSRVEGKHYILDAEVAWGEGMGMGHLNYIVCVLFVSLFGS